MPLQVLRRVVDVQPSDVWEALPLPGWRYLAEVVAHVCLQHARRCSVPGPAGLACRRQSSKANWPFSEKVAAVTVVDYPRRVGGLLL